MQNVKIKIVGYEEITGSLLACFASDTTASVNPEDYQSVAFQPATMWPDVSDPEEIKRRIAQAGIVIVEQQVRTESLVSSVQRVSELKNLVGNTFTYSALSLAEPEDPPTPILVM